MKRTELKRKPPLRSHEPSLSREPKPRACAYEPCGRQFMPMRPMQKVCGPLCASRLVRKAKAEERAQDREKRQSMKSLRTLLAELQVAFNAYIRERDRNTTCICCNKPFEPQKPGGSMDAGHYLARSIAPQHRFNENNVFGQRKNCNRPGGTTRVAFRAGVVARIGLAAVEALEADVSVPKWPRDWLQSQKKHYLAKTRELRKARSCTPAS